MKRIRGLILVMLFSGAALFAQQKRNPLATSSSSNSSLPNGANGTNRVVLSGTIQGKVYLPNGKPAANVVVQLSPENTPGMQPSVTTNPSGAFQFEGATVGDNYYVNGSLPGFESFHRLVMMTGPSVSVTITLAALPGQPIPPTATVPVQFVNVPPKALEAYEDGMQAEETGKMKKAEGAFRKAVGIYPSFAEAYMHLSAVYADQKRFPDADKAIGKAMKLAKENADSYAYLGYVDLREKKSNEAETAFEKSLSISKDDWFAHLELGRLRYERKQFAEAYPDLERAHKLHPQTRSVHLLLYDDLIRLGKYEEALAELDDIVRLYPGSPEAARMKKMRPALAAAAAKQP